MNPSELKELTQLAMLAELARPLTHECNNFLNNLLLQLAITEKSFPESSRTEWANIRREGKKLASLFQQWQRHRKQPAEAAANVELIHLVQQTIEDLRSDTQAVQFVVHPGDTPSVMTGCAAEVQRLCYLLFSYVVANVQNSGVDNPLVEIRIGKSENQITLRFLDVGPVDANLRWSDFNDLPNSDRVSLSLPALACKSIVDRLNGGVRVETVSNGRIALAIHFPATLL